VFNCLVSGVGYCECTIDSPACACALRIVGKKKQKNKSLMQVAMTKNSLELGYPQLHEL